MPVKVRCSGCQKVLAAPDTARGKAIRCPACQTKIRVPAGDGGKSRSKATAKAGAPKPGSEFDLAALDLSRLEDTSVRICPKCGYEIRDEEARECGGCGYDFETGASGAEAQKIREQRSTPTGDFLRESWRSSVKFIKKNPGLAIRTSVYTLLLSVLAFGCFFMIVWCSRQPPKWFWTFMTVVLVLPIPGWYWHLTTEILNATLQKKDRLKRVNFDLFLNMSLGIKTLSWIVVFGSPFWLIFGGITWLATGDQPGVLGGVLLGIAASLTLLPLPPVMAHMSMPITVRGWMVHHMYKIVGKTIAPLLAWWTLVIGSMLPIIGGLVIVGIFYGSDIVTKFEDVAAESRAALENLDHRGLAKVAAPGQAGAAKVETSGLEWTILIVPGVVWTLVSALLGFVAVLNMRSMGVYASTYRKDLSLLTRAKEATYVVKERGEDFDADKERQKEELRKKLSLLGGLAALFIIINLVMYFTSGKTLIPGIGGDAPRPSAAPAEGEAGPEGENAEGGAEPDADAAADDAEPAEADGG